MALIIQDGGDPIGVGADQYPFVQTGPDTEGLLADFYLGHFTDARPPLRLTWIYGITQPPVSSICTQSSDELPSGAIPSREDELPIESSSFPDPTHCTDVLVQDADDQVVFDSTTASYYNRRAWGSRLTLHEWRGDGNICLAVQHNGHQWRDLDFPIENAPISAVLDPRTYERVPDQVQALRVGGNYLTGRITIAAGNNHDLSTSAGKTFAHRRVRRINIGVVPGAGEGRFDDCSDELTATTLASFGGAGPDAYGNVSIDGGDCFMFGQPSVNIGLTAKLINEHAFSIEDACKPCCSCDEAVSVYRRATRIWRNYRRLGRGFYTVRRHYKTVINRWMESKACREARPTRVYLLPTSGGLLSVVASLCNAARECRGPLSITLRFATIGPAAMPIADSVFRYISAGRMPEPYELSGTWPEYTATWDSVNPAHAVRIKFQLAFAGVADGDWVSVTATVRFGGEILDIVTITSRLRV